jgi:ABC-type enterobactin transport system permease subunit
MNTIKTQIGKVTSNPIGAIVGGVAVYYAAKKYGNVTNRWMLIGAGVLGVIGGAMAQASFKKGAPTAATIK